MLSKIGERSLFKNSRKIQALKFLTENYHWLVINQAFIQTSKLAKLQRKYPFSKLGKIVILLKLFFQFDEKIASVSPKIFVDHDQNFGGCLYQP